MTSFLPTLLFADPSGNIFWFSCIASLNHLLKCLKYGSLHESIFNSTNYIVKMFLTPIILNDTILDSPWIVKIIQVCDIYPFIITILITYFPESSEFSMKNISDLVGGIVRQGVIFFKLCEMLYKHRYSTYHWIFTGCLCLLKCMYYYERRERLNDDRSNFGTAHHAEHIFLIGYFGLFNKTLENRLSIVVYFVTVAYFILPPTILLAYNLYILNTFYIPKNVDKVLHNIYLKKVYTNVYSRKIYNYLVKPFSPLLSFTVITYPQIQSMLMTIRDQIDVSRWGKPDVIIGVCSGGAFCSGFLKETLETRNRIPLVYVKTKVWSNQSLANNVKNIHNYYSKPTNEYLSINNRVHVNVINQETLNDILLYSQVHKVLIFDDTICTGKTINSCKGWVQEQFPNADIKIACLICNPDLKSSKFVNFASCYDQVPILWPWGAELD